MPEPLRLLDQLWQTALTRFGRPEPAARYVEWVRAFILFHGKRHPGELGLAEVAAFSNTWPSAKKTHYDPSNRPARHGSSEI